MKIYVESCCCLLGEYKDKNIFLALKETIKGTQVSYKLESYTFLTKIQVKSYVNTNVKRGFL